MKELMSNIPDVSREVPEGARVLVHACCAPCSSAMLECLLQSGVDVTLFYSNSNIYPREEYDHRSSECARYCKVWGVEMVEDEYDYASWMEQVGCGRESEPERGARCAQCFRFRLQRAAQYAHSHGYGLLTTTLASSRWKSLEQVNAAGEAACAPYDDVQWWSRNWRKDGLQERRNQIIKEQDFYNQLYCGCEFSRRRLEEQE